MTKHASKAERRGQILSAAVTCFARKGYHLTTMDDIVVESGLSKGSLYWHFRNKKAILLSLMDSYFERFERELQDLIQGLPSAAAKLERLGQYVTGMFDSADTLALVSIFVDFYAETRHDDEVNDTLRGTLETYIDYLEAIVQEAVDRGEFRAIDARQIVVALMAAFDGLYLYRMLLGDALDWSKVGQLFVETVLNGLRA
jgi:AcrR family transcriptional regulator